VSSRRFLTANDAWARRWYQPNTARFKERQLFAGS
jgi:hypothetical protein